MTPRRIDRVQIADPVGGRALAEVIAGAQTRTMNFDQCRLTPELRDALLREQNECTVAWTNAQGWPVAVVQTYVWAQGAFWITAFRDKPRVGALAAKPQAAVVVSSKGTDVGPEKMLSARVTATLLDDAATQEWFYPAFAARAVSDPGAIAGFAKILGRQDRVIIRLDPVSWTTFDGVLLRAPRAKPA